MKRTGLILLTLGLLVWGVLFLGEAWAENKTQTHEISMYTMTYNNGWLDTQEGVITSSGNDRQGNLFESTAYISFVINNGQALAATNSSDTWTWGVDADGNADGSKSNMHRDTNYEYAGRMLTGGETEGYAESFGKDIMDEGEVKRGEFSTTNIEGTLKVIEGQAVTDSTTQTTYTYLERPVLDADGKATRDADGNLICVTEAGDTVVGDVIVNETKNVSAFGYESILGLARNTTITSEVETLNKRQFDMAGDPAQSTRIQTTTVEYDEYGTIVDANAEGTIEGTEYTASDGWVTFGGDGADAATTSTTFTMWNGIYLTHESTTDRLINGPDEESQVVSSHVEGDIDQTEDITYDPIQGPDEESQVVNSHEEKTTLLDDGGKVTTITNSESQYLPAPDQFDPDAEEAESTEITDSEFQYLLPTPDQFGPDATETSTIYNLYNKNFELTATYANNVLSGRDSGLYKYIDAEGNILSRYKNEAGNIGYTYVNPETFDNSRIGYYSEIETKYGIYDAYRENRYFEPIAK